MKNIFIRLPGELVTAFVYTLLFWVRLLKKCNLKCLENKVRKPQIISYLFIYYLVIYY